MPADTTLPNYKRPEVLAADKDVALVRDLLGGTRAMHDRSTEYIRKWPDEKDEIYDFRRNIESCFEGLGRTLSASVGMLFSKPPTISWNASEEVMTPQWANLDNAGTAGPVLVKRFSEYALGYGIGAIVVDHPPVPDGGTDNNAVDIALSLRPVWAIYERSQIINWRTAVINNKKVLTLVVFHEHGEALDGPFGVKPVHRWRVLELVQDPKLGWQARWTLYESDTETATRKEDFRDAGTGVFRNKAGQIADFLPVAIAYTGRTNIPMTATIPLLGVAWANLSHYQQSTDLRYYRALAAYPQPVIVGTIPDDPITKLPGKVKLGPGVVINVQGQGASFEWKELQGSSMDQIEKGIVEKLRQMSMLGMAFLTGEKRVAETAEAKRLDATAENSTLATAAQGIEDAINMAFEFHAWYVGIEKKDAPVLTINRDFEATVMDPLVMTAWVTACEKIGMPIRLLLEAWQAGGRIGPDEDLDAIESDIAVNAAAEAERQRQAAADALALQQQKLAA